MFVVGACRPPQLKYNFDFGEVENNQYSNEFFQCTIDLLPDWVIQSRDEMEKLQDLGTEIIAGDDKKLERQLKASDIRSAKLITVFKYEIGTATEFNPNISIVAENIKYSSNIRSGEDYLNHSRKLMEQSQFKYDSISTDFDKVDFSGIIFSRMYTSVIYMEIPIRQEYFSTVMNGFSFNIVISYSSNEQKNELNEMLGTLRFGV